MPIRGENVGTAYVRILADGSGLSKSIADDLDDTDGVFSEKGREHAELHDKEFRKQLRKDRPAMKKDIEGIFDDHSRKAKQIAAEMGTNFFKELERSIIKQNGRDLGERIMRDIRKGFTLSGGDKNFFGKDFENLLGRLPAMTRTAAIEINREWDKMYADAHRMNVKFDAERLRSITTQQRQIEMLAKAESQAYAERDRRFEASADRAVRAFQRIQRGEANSGEKIRDSIDKTISHVKELHQELERNPNLGGDRDHFRGILTDMEVGLARVFPGLRRFNGALDRTGPAMGRAFGKESRSESLHFFGSAVGFFTSIPAKIGGAVEKIATFGKTFSELRAAGNGVFASLRGASSGMAGLGSSAAAAAVAIPVVVAVVGALVSAMSLLLGIVVALASALANALIGALAAVAGALAPVALGIGVLVGAIASMSDAQKKMVKEAIQPFVSGIKDIGKAAADAIFGGKQFEDTVHRMTNALTSSNMKKFVVEIADAIGNVGNAWAKQLDSPGFQRWLTAMGKTIPGQIEGLGKAFGNIVGGFGNTLLAMQPLVTDFVNWLVKITDEWAKWTGSKEGQEAMLSFFERAKESIRSVAHFLGEVGGLMADLLFNTTGQETGNTLFDDMADGIARFRSFIADGGLEKWFTDAKKFAGDLGDAIVMIGKVLDGLDSPGFRAFASSMIDGFSRMTKVINAIVEPIAKFADGLDKLLHGDFSGAFDVLLDNFRTLPGNIFTIMTLGFGDGIVDWVRGIFSSMGEAIGSIDWGSIGSTIIDGITGAFSGVGDIFGNIFSGAGDIASQIGQWFAGAPGAIGQALSNMGSLIIDFFSNLPRNIGFALGFLVGSIVKAFVGLGTAIGHALTDAASAIGDWVSGLPEQFGDLAGVIGDALGDAASAVGDWVTDVGTQIGDWAAGLPEQIGSALGDAATAVGDWFAGLGPAIGNGLLTAGQAIADWATALPGQIGGWFAGLPEQMMTIGTDIINGLWGGVTAAWDAVIGGIGAFVQGFIDGFKAALGIASPSTVFMSIGRDVILGLLQGLAEMGQQVVSFLIGLAGQMGQALIGGLGSAFSQVSALAQQFGGFLRSSLGSALSFVGDKARQVGGFFSGVLSSGMQAGQRAAQALGSLLRGALSSAMEAARGAAQKLGSMASGAMSTGLRAGAKAADAVKSAISGIGSVIGGVISKVQSLISWIGKIHMPSLGGIASKFGLKTGGLVDMFGAYRVKKMAYGGMANFAQHIQAGEAGREAIVPLDRPLGQVDPAVRLLSAFAQGKLGNQTSHNEKSVDISGWQIVSPNNSETVAKEVLDALIAKLV
jgi:phage-related protein